MPTFKSEAILDRFATDLNGQNTIQLHWSKCTWKDDALIERGNHVALLVPGDDVDAAIARNAAALQEMGYPVDAAKSAAAINAAKTFIAETWA